MNELKLTKYRTEIANMGVKKSYIAKEILGISVVLFSYYLTGTREMPEHIEKKLKEYLKID